MILFVFCIIMHTHLRLESMSIKSIQIILCFQRIMFTYKLHPTMCSFHLCQTLLQIFSNYHMFPHIKSTTPFPPAPPTQKQVPFLPKHLILLKHSCTRCGKGSFSHYLQGFSTIPSGDRRISEPSTVSCHTRLPT